MGSLSTAFALSNNAEFRGLVQAALAKASYDVINESGATQYHTERLAWAITTIKNPEDVMEKMIWMVLQNPTIISSGTTFVENDIQFVVNSYINTFAL
jgi:hypothetical protein